MERVYLQWNLPNWITVFLMATVGYSIITAAIAYMHKDIPNA
jgi:hypothetical protein